MQSVASSLHLGDSEVFVYSSHWKWRLVNFFFPLQKWQTVPSPHCSHIPHTSTVSSPVMPKGQTKRLAHLNCKCLRFIMACHAQKMLPKDVDGSKIVSSGTEGFLGTELCPLDLWKIRGPRKSTVPHPPPWTPHGGYSATVCGILQRYKQWDYHSTWNHKNALFLLHSQFTQRTSITNSRSHKRHGSGPGCAHPGCVYWRAGCLQTFQPMNQAL